MTPSLFLIGAGAGAASALLYASAAAGSSLAIVTFVLAPLPILLAGLGWRHHAGLIGAAVGTAMVAAFAGPLAGVVYALGVAGPAWILAYLALLGRAGPDGVVTEWYPVGRLVLVCALAGAAFFAATVFVVAESYEAYRAILRVTAEQALRLATRSPDEGAIELPSGQDPAVVVDAISGIAPDLGATALTLSLILNVWLAGLVTAKSGRLVRPWPDLPAMEFPRNAGIGLLIATAATLLPGYPGFVAGLLANTLILAFALLGLATLHVVTRSLAARRLVLTLAYLLLPFIVFFVAVLGVAELIFGIRARFGGRRGPPPPVRPS